MSAETPHSVAHQSVLLEEALHGLALKPDGAYVDATFGRGGHSAALLARLGPAGRLLALDRDPEALMAAFALQRDPRFAIRQANFSELTAQVAAWAPSGVDGVLLDLGVSSPQLDQAERGFSFRRDGPLDMRMDPTTGESAAEFLARADVSEIAQVLREFGEERHAGKVARAIVVAREQAPILRTAQLARIIAEAMPRREPGIDPATRSFQGLRIRINDELGELDAVLPQALAALRPGGRLAVISFHSLEDRRVKQFIARHARPPEIPAGLAVREADRPASPLRSIGRAVFASPAEVQRNPRARSAVLRVAERTAVSVP